MGKTDHQTFREFSKYVSDHKKRIIDQILQQRTRFLTFVLDDIYQTQNSSAALRSAEAMGLQDAHFIENDNAFKVNKNVSRGAAKWMSIYRYNNTNHDNRKQCIQHLQEKNYQIITTDPLSKNRIEDLDFTKKKVFIVGHEKKGIHPTFQEAADGSVALPMYGFTESFNLSVSLALILQKSVELMRAQNNNWSLSREEKEALKIEWSKKSVRHGPKIYDYIAKTYSNDQY